MSLQLNALPFVAAICSHLNKFISVLTHRETPLPLPQLLPPVLLPSKVTRTHSACLSTLCVCVCVCNKSFLAAVVVVVIGGGLSSGTPAVQIFIIVILPSHSHSSFHNSLLCCRCCCYCYSGWARSMSDFIVVVVVSLFFLLALFTLLLLLVVAVVWFVFLLFDFQLINCFHNLQIQQQIQWVSVDLSVCVSVWVLLLCDDVGAVAAPQRQTANFSFMFRVAASRPRTYTTLYTR